MAAERGPTPHDRSAEIVQALREYDRPFMGTGELAEELGYSSNPGVAKHLERAADKGQIQKATVSGYNIWHLPELVERDRVRTDPPPAGGGGGSPPEPHEEPDAETSGFLSGAKQAGLKYGKVGDSIILLFVILGAVGWVFTDRLSTAIEGRIPETPAVFAAVFSLWLGTLFGGFALTASAAGWPSPIEAPTRWAGVVVVYVLVAAHYHFNLARSAVESVMGDRA